MWYRDTFIYIDFQYFVAMLNKYAFCVVFPFYFDTFCMKLPRLAIVSLAKNHFTSITNSITYTVLNYTFYIFLIALVVIVRSWGRFNYSFLCFCNKSTKKFKHATVLAFHIYSTRKNLSDLRLHMIYFMFIFSHRSCCLGTLYLTLYTTDTSNSTDRASSKLSLVFHSSYVFVFSNKMVFPH